MMRHKAWLIPICSIVVTVLCWAAAIVWAISLPEAPPGELPKDHFIKHFGPVVALAISGFVALAVLPIWSAIMFVIAWWRERSAA